MQVRFSSLTFLALLLSVSTCEASQTSTMSKAFGIDADSLLRHVEVLASDEFQGRRAGSEGGLMAARYVEEAMSGMDLAPACGGNSVQEFSFTPRRASEPVAARNVIVRIPGTSDSKRIVVVTAHFDHLGEGNGQIYNGADDNASGTAALLEIARYFSTHSPNHTLIFAALDAEESGLQGARAFVDSECFSDYDVVLNINMDMISRSAVDELYVSGTLHYPFLKPVLEGVEHPDNLKILFGHDQPGTGSDDWTNSSDHAPFHQAGIPFLYFGVEDHPGYHRPNDVFEDIFPVFFHTASEYVLEVIRETDLLLDDLAIDDE